MLSRIRAVLASTLLCLLALVAPAHATFPGKNGKIAFTQANAIHTVNPDGTGDTTLSFGLEPAWSADGTRLAYRAGGGALFVANADGSGAVRIGDPTYASNPAWSPDGRIAYDERQSFCGGHQCFLGPAGIYVINSDGTNNTRLGYGIDPIWSPDGTKIAFSDSVVQSFGFSTDIFTMNPDGTGITNLTRTDSTYDSTPSWSPDGSRIAFTSADQFGGSQDIYVMNADGSGVTRLTNDGPQESYPAWSPDGTKIAFQSDRYSSGPVIVVMSSDGTNRTDIVTGAEQPDWQPLPGPRRSDFKSAAKFCKTERAFLGERQFRQKYGAGPKGANAYGKCVSGK
jgi:Tol biopolymer transport system component